MRIAVVCFACSRFQCIFSRLNSTFLPRKLPVNSRWGKEHRYPNARVCVRAGWSKANEACSRVHTRTGERASQEAAASMDGGRRMHGRERVGEARAGGCACVQGASMALCSPLRLVCKPAPPLLCKPVYLGRLPSLLVLGKLIYLVLCV